MNSHMNGYSLPKDIAMHTNLATYSSILLIKLQSQTLNVKLKPSLLLNSSLHVYPLTFIIKALNLVTNI